MSHTPVALELEVAFLHVCMRHVIAMSHVLGQLVNPHNSPSNMQVVFPDHSGDGTLAGECTIVSRSSSTALLFPVVLGPGQNRLPNACIGGSW